MGDPTPKITSIIAPPMPPKNGSLLETLKFLGKDYQHKYDIWNRTGGYNSNITFDILEVNTTETGNVDNTENDLIVYTLEANKLAHDGDFIEVDAFGKFAANANNKRLRLYIGSSAVLDTSAVAANSGSWIIQSKVIRVSINSLKVITTIISSNSSIVTKSEYGVAPEDTAKEIIIKCTALAIAAGDILQEGLTVKLLEKGA